MMISTGDAAGSSLAPLLSFSTAVPPAANSFAQQLASALSGYLSQASSLPGSFPNFEIDVQAAPGQTSGGRQFLVTVRDAGATPVTSATPLAAPVTLMSIPRPPVTAASILPPPAPIVADGKHLVNGRPVLNSADAYWATQPAAVQALQNLNSESARSDLAHELADQGYLIDVPIMVWGWDPLATMLVRKNQGFTWIPSAKMDPVRVAPGINFGGLPSYDAEHPPEGSIRVTTDWAKGLEYTDGWLHPGDY